MESFFVGFNKLEVGQRFCGECRTITETDLAFSCMLSGDWHPIHADQAFAATTPVGTRILHGSFGILVAMGMATRLPMFTDRIIGATGLREWTFRKPLAPGDTVYLEAVIESKHITSDGRRAIIERRLALKNQHLDVVQEGFVGTMIQLEQTS